MGGTVPIAIARNDDPRSPVSISRIGTKTRYLEKSTIYSQKEAQDYADYILK
nr:MAG TPA: protein of unknown function (DUF5048) [Caudoviricetes sp.]